MNESIQNFRSPVRDEDVGVHLLQSRFPAGYSRWILGGVLVALLGYGATCVGLFLQTGALRMWLWPDPWVFLMAVLALHLWRRGRLRAAGSLVLGGVVAEVHVAFMMNPVQSWTPTAMMVPAVMSVTALWLGPRLAQWLGWVIMVTIPLAIGLSGLVGATEGFATPGFPYIVIVLATTVFVSNTLLVTFMRWLADSLRRSETEERRMRELIEAVPDGVVVVDSAGCITELNAEAGRIMGGEPAVLRGRRIEELVDGPEDWDLQEWLATPVRAREPVEMQGGPAGVPLEVRASDLSRHGGKRDTLLVMRDITRRREAEERERQLQGQLLQAQKMEAVGLLAGGVAHDFNNLITVIGGYGAMLAQSSDPEARKYAPDIMAVQERGATLVRHLLTFARREMVQPQVMDLAACVQNAVPLLNRMLGERVLLAVHAPESCPVLADPGQMEQVLINLAVNARDALPKGGRVEVSCLSRENRIELEVKDEGTGMAPDVIERIFDPFFTTKPPGQGTGLGLSTVHGIVQAAGGGIVVKSRPGGGSRFIVSLPRSTLPLDEPALAPMVELQASVSGTSILVADDNDAVRSYLERLLRRAGFQVRLARSGDQALEILMQATHPPDLLLADVVMAGMTGPEAAELAARRWPGLRTLFMSGYLGVSAETELFDTTSNLIMKPFGAGELLRRIELVLAQEPQKAARHLSSHPFPGAR